MGRAGDGALTHHRNANLQFLVKRASTGADIFHFGAACKGCASFRLAVAVSFLLDQLLQYRDQLLGVERFDDPTGCPGFPSGILFFGLRLCGKHEYGNEGVSR